MCWVSLTTPVIFISASGASAKWVKDHPSVRSTHQSLLPKFFSGPKGGIPGDLERILPLIKKVNIAFGRIDTTITLAGIVNLR